jgi:hypothetical protein
VSRCNRTGAPGATKRTDRNGEEYWLLRLIPREDAWSPPRYSLADGKGEVADPDTLHRVYGELLPRLPISPAVTSLEARGLSRSEILARGYRWLPERGRPKAIRALIEAGLEEHLPRTPGMFVRQPDEEGRTPY